jgi:hypothetical protein
MYVPPLGYKRERAHTRLDTRTQALREDSTGVEDISIHAFSTSHQAIQLTVDLGYYGPCGLNPLSPCAYFAFIYLLRLTLGCPLFL